MGSEFWIFAVLGGVVLVGGIMGFGKVLGQIASGIFGKVSAVVLTYFLYGVVLDFEPVKRLITLMVNKLTENGNWICKILLAIRVDMIVLAIGLFFAIYLALRLAVAMVGGIVSCKVLPLIVINRVGGAALLLSYACVWMLIVFQVCSWIWGTQGGIYPYLQGTVLRLDQLYLNNPLNAIFETVKHSLGGLGS